MLDTYNLKVYLSGVLYTALISLSCYWIKSYDGVVSTKGINTQTDVPHQLVTSGYLNQMKIIKKSDRVKTAVEEGIYWSEELESLLPAGISTKEAEDFFHDVTTKRVISAVQAGNHTCSNTTPSNKYITLEGNQTMCARNRKHCWKCLEGEVLSYHMACLLGLDNVPPVKMVTYDTSNDVWYNFPTLDKWAQGERVTMSMWINQLGPAISLPDILLQNLKTNKTLTSRNSVLTRLSKQELLQLVQLSDMLIFDFLVFHGDRIVRNKIQEDKPDGWYSVTLESDHQHLTLKSPIKNLCLQKQNNKFWLIDNEMTFEALTPKVQKNLYFSEDMVKTMCIFRKSTITNVRKMLEKGNPCKMLYKRIKKIDPVFWIMINRQRHSIFIEDLNQKLMTQLTKLILWVKECQKMIKT